MYLAGHGGRDRLTENGMQPLGGDAGTIFTDPTASNIPLVTIQRRMWQAEDFRLSRNRGMGMRQEWPLLTNCGGSQWKGSQS
jgi:hypothetical protein